MIVSANIHVTDGQARPGIVELLGPGIGVMPCATFAGRLTGEYTVVQIYAGKGWQLTPEAGCIVCARNAAQTALDSGVNWDRPADELQADLLDAIAARQIFLTLFLCNTGRDCDDRPEVTTGFGAVQGS